MAADDLGQKLYDAGWQQGILLPVLESAVHFDLDDPLTSIARAARPGCEVEYQAKAASGKIPSSRRAIGVGAPRKTSERLVIISQTCDIVKKSGIEPVVWAIRAFFTKNAETLRRAGGSSKRQFLLDEQRGLIAEMSNITSIEKPVLAALTPEQGASDEETRGRFANWLADRFSRVPHSDEIVGAIVRPILDNLRRMQEDGDADLTALDHVREVRFAKLESHPPYDVRLLFMISKEGLPDGGLALARLIGRIESWLVDGGQAKLMGADVATPGDIVLEDYLNTDKLDLDEYTYRGRTIQGLVPLPRL